MPDDKSVGFAWPEPLDLHALAMKDPRPPRFIIPDLMPADYVTLLAGHGGAGKSGIALHLALCVALEREWCGMVPEPRRVLYLSCEDRWPVLHWRLRHIAAYLGVDLGEAHGRLFVQDLVGEDVVLWERDPKTGFTSTSGLACLRRSMESTGAELLVVDGISDTFAGNENARGDVKRYVGALLSLIPPDGGVLLVGHVAKLAASSPGTSEGYSGSTAWHNAVRARWYLRPETVEGEDDARPTGSLLLELQKSNLGPSAPTIRFRWDEDAHLFVGHREAGDRGIVDDIRDRTERTAILIALRSAGAANVAVPAATTGPRTAYHVLSAQAGFPESLRAGRPSVRRFWRHLEALRAIAHVCDTSIARTDRHRIAALALTPEGLRACDE